jgi:hypothetical protein
VEMGRSKSLFIYLYLNFMSFQRMSIVWKELSLIAIFLFIWRNWLWSSYFLCLTPPPLVTMEERGYGWQSGFCFLKKWHDWI